MINSLWKVVMKIPGTTKVQLSLLTILATSSVTSTSLLIRQQVKSTSVESTLCKRRKPKGGKRRVTSESDWKKYYGSSPELKADISRYGKDNFSREILSLHETLGKVNYEETKQLFLNNVLMESLDDGTPMYYNSNILGRYMKKDYGNFERNSETDS